MAVIVDASIVVKWFTTEVLHEAARQLLMQSEPLIAPDILAAEFANAMWAKARRQEIGAGEAERVIVAVSVRACPSYVHQPRSCCGRSNWPERSIARSTTASISRLQTRSGCRW